MAVASPVTTVLADTVQAGTGMPRFKLAPPAGGKPRQRQADEPRACGTGKSPALIFR